MNWRLEGLTTQLDLCSKALRAVSEVARPGGVAVLLQQQRHLQEALVMIRLEVEGFAVAIDGTIVAAGITHQTEQIIRLGRPPALAQVGLTNLSGLA